jgi:hypothetical protein
MKNGRDINTSYFWAERFAGGLGKCNCAAAFPRAGLQSHSGMTCAALTAASQSPSEHCTDDFKKK